MAVVFQPLRETATGSLVGFEALLRWHHPSGSVPRKSFIFQAERSGEIKRLGNWVLHRSLDQIVQWRHLRPNLDVNVHVNVAHLQLLDIDFPSLVRRAIRRRSLKPAQLVLELTNHDSLFDDKTRPALVRLRRNGIKIAADDVGSEDFVFDAINSPHFRSLIGEIKLDKSLVWNLQIDEIHEVVNVAREMGAKVVAEGIENDSQIVLLSELGVDILQGYHQSLGRPLTVEDATDLLTNEPRKEHIIDRSQDFGVEI